ncbi:winged helix-turn-helix domain-containing protein (plasmid) [Bacteroides thetaiotaomicron]|nr:winged helix-turn-helix domain-containing protein [Bacteroides thetaiotaomicron]
MLAADETALAAGWLARENKIYIERRNGLAAYQERVIQRIKRINDKRWNVCSA